MEKISYMVDEKGKKQFVVIPLDIINDESFEDLYDILFAKKQLENQKFVPFP